jgi:protein-tyrosine phosphatase
MPKPCSRNHVGAEPIQVGPYQVYATGMQYLWRGLVDVSQFDILMPLEHTFSDYYIEESGQEVWWEAAIADYQPPGPHFVDLMQRLVDALKAGKKVLIFCTASHGRTGTVLAGLIALLEPETEDPIAAVRERHCEMSVETPDQAAWVRALRKQALDAQVSAALADGDPC